MLLQYAKQDITVNEHYSVLICNRSIDTKTIAKAGQHNVCGKAICAYSLGEVVH